MPSQKEYQPPAPTAASRGIKADLFKVLHEKSKTLFINAPTSYQQVIQSTCRDTAQKITKKCFRKKLLASKLPFICYKMLIGL